jgi:hypothetical protein
LSVERHLLRDPVRADAVPGADLDPTRTCQAAPPKPPATAEPVADASTPELFHCDTLYVSLQANGPAPLDIGLFFVDSTGALQPLPGLDSIRLDRKSPPLILPLTISTWDWSRSVPSTLGLERLVILGVRRSEKVDRAYQADFSAALGLTDQAAATRSAARANLPFLALLGPDGSERRRAIGQGDPRQDGFVHVVSWKSARPGTAMLSESRGSL